MQIQSKKGSFIEACVNTAIGFIISLVANPVICWMLGIKANGKQMIGYVAAFTVLSVLRSYVIRRWFNHSVENFVNKKLMNKQAIPDMPKTFGDEDGIMSMDRLDLIAYADIYGVTIRPDWNNVKIRDAILHDIKNSFNKGDTVKMNKMADEIAKKF